MFVAKLAMIIDTDDNNEPNIVNNRIPNLSTKILMMMPTQKQTYFIKKFNNMNQYLLIIIKQIFT